MAKRAYHHGDLRQALIDEARRSIEADGASGFSLAKVAAALGVSTAAPYHHFRTKEEVLVSVAEQVQDELMTRVRASALEVLGTRPGKRSVRQALSAACHEFLQFSLDHPNLFRLFSVDYRPGPESAALRFAGAVSSEQAELLAGVGLLDLERAEDFRAAVYVVLRGVAAVARESPSLVRASSDPHALLERMLDNLLLAHAPRR